MIPRSIDLTKIHPSANALYVISFFAAGFLLSRYWPMLPRVARVAYALAFRAVAFGLLYASQSTLLCSGLHARRTTRFRLDARSSRARCVPTCPGVHDEMAVSQLKISDSVVKPQKGGWMQMSLHT